MKEYLNPKKRRLEQSVGQAAQVIAKKRNWSAPGPDRIANFWWKKVGALHAVVPESFHAIIQGDWDIPFWFTEGKTTHILQSGGFLSENQRISKRKSVDKHLDAYLDTLSIDRVVF